MDRGKISSFVGHLFQGRFRWELVDNDPYYLEVSRYIHLLCENKYY